MLTVHWSAHPRRAK